MATLPGSLLYTQTSSFVLKRSKNALVHQNSPVSLSCRASSSGPRAELDTVPRQLGHLLGLSALAGAMVAFPHHAHAAEVAASSSADAWSALVASEPKNALSLPTWVIHVASVAECRVPLPCRMLESVFGGSGEVESSFLRETELANALSLPTWFIHVASVIEWVTAMALVWRYGDTPGNSTWKGLAWGMVPLLGGAMCACTWHFFYNAQSLEILVVLQALLTVIGNVTMWIAAFRIYQASQKQSQKSS